MRLARVPADLIWAPSHERLDQMILPAPLQPRAVLRLNADRSWAPSGRLHHRVPEEGTLSRPTSRAHRQTNSSPASAP